MPQNIALSWSGGKDGCLALDKLVRQGASVSCLLTTVPAEIGRTFGHGEKTDMVRLQAGALSMPVHFIPCTFEGYTEAFVNALKDYKEKYKLTAVGYGDLYLMGHREWGEETAEAAGLLPVYPLWMTREQSLGALKAFVQSGYKAKVIRVREDILDDSWLGREVDRSFWEDIQETESCPMGESGEYHTFVYDGPLFRKKIVLGDPEIIKLETTKKLEFRKALLQDK